MLAKEQHAVSTVRLILAALTDRDIAARTKGNSEGISEEEIFAMLQTMVKQRHESIAMYERGGRLELAQQEADEIKIIECFLPKQLGDDEIESAVSQCDRRTGRRELEGDGWRDGSFARTLRRTAQLRYSRRDRQTVVVLTRVSKSLRSCAGTDGRQRPRARGEDRYRDSELPLREFGYRLQDMWRSRCRG